MILMTELTAIAEEQRRLTERIMRLVDNLGDGAPPNVFDPDTDEPPVKPWVDGDRTQKNWCALMMWAGLLSINVRHGRGATKPEVVEIAKQAGYQDGRGWNSWSGWEEDETGRWVRKVGAQHLKHYLKEVGKTLPKELMDGIERLLDADGDAPR